MEKRDLNLPSALSESALCNFLGRGVQMCLNAFEDGKLTLKTAPLYVGTPPGRCSSSYGAEASVLGLLFGLISASVAMGHILWVLGQSDPGTK